MKIKSESPTKWNETLQAQLDGIAEQIVDVQEEIENLPKATIADGYSPEKGTENLIHIKIFQGARFDKKTGNEIVTPRPVMMTQGEWKLFKENHERLGYSISEVLYDPYNEVEPYLKALKEKEENTNK